MAPLFLNPGLVKSFWRRKYSVPSVSIYLMQLWPQTSHFLSLHGEFFCGGKVIWPQSDPTTQTYSVSLSKTAPVARCDADKWNWEWIWDQWGEWTFSCCFLDAVWFDSVWKQTENASRVPAPPLILAIRCFYSCGMSKYLAWKSFLLPFFQINNNKALEI